MDEMTDAQVMELALTKMSRDQRDHLRLVIKELIRCYTNDDVHGMVIVGEKDSPKVHLFAVNSNEMDASGLLTAADQYVNFRVMDDAPPKELFN